jgi:hypothetical protein
MVSTKKIPARLKIKCSHVWLWTGEGGRSMPDLGDGRSRVGVPTLQRERKRKGEWKRPCLKRFGRFGLLVPFKRVGWPD